MNKIKDFYNIRKELKKLPKRIAVLAEDLFDKNFEEQGFFGEKWQASKYVQKTRSEGSLLIRTGNLRSSLYYEIQGYDIMIKSNMPYAGIHNEGGTIKHPGGTAYKVINKKAVFVSNKTAKGKGFKRTKLHNIEIPKRQFVGNHQKLTEEINKEFERIFKI